MAASVSGGGYDYKLVDESLVGEYTCPVCTLVLRDPQLTRCGHHICESCIQQLKDKGNDFTCPTCRADLNNNFFPDESVNRKIKSLQVYCNNKDDGCEWKGDLKDIEDHLQECPYQLVSCSNDCGMDSVQRRHLQNHLENDCPKRLIKCQYCNEEGHHQDITGDHHFGVCPEYPTRCTNEECSKKIPRHQMPSHKASCPKEMICCGYRSVGCEEKMKREEQEEHNEQWRERHLQLAVGEITKLKATNEKLQFTENVVKAIVTFNERLNTNSVIKFGGFASYKRNNTRWFSPGFLTSPGGYKMSLNVYANGNGDGRGTHVSCYVHLIPGEYDDILEWPFHGKVMIEILNQLENENHHKGVVCFDESTPQECKNRVIGRVHAVSGWGSPQFISHSQLDVNPSLNCQYLKDDTLYFKVTVIVTSNTKQWLVV